MEVDEETQIDISVIFISVGGVLEDLIRSIQMASKAADDTQNTTHNVVVCWRSLRPQPRAGGHTSDDGDSRE
ncbi:hypothetical protein BHM03_00006455 [Ensete ventricosum]|uniref:Uncharacterized protein n=1 Tax=Ensete ventricosum TaxID=4639 RepID=A0A445MBQ5_ENSVE|nr:hypothetical protein BHM03_00006455 [Ensete ventricosum]